MQCLRQRSARPTPGDSASRLQALWHEDRRNAFEPREPSAYTSYPPLPLFVGLRIPLAAKRIRRRCSHHD